MKFQDFVLLSLFTISLLFFGCNGDDDSPPAQPGATCDLICLNGGLVNTDSCFCACLPGFSGDSCQVVEPICELQCFNGGILEVDSCSCDCPEGFSGDSCEIELTKTDILISKNWLVVGLTIEPGLDLNGDGNLENDLIPFIDTCNLDNFLKFYADGSYTAEEGALKCDPGDPDVVESGNWLWNSDETRLIFEPSSGTNREAEIVSISSTEIVLEFTTVNNNITYTETQTWN